MTIDTDRYCTVCGNAAADKALRRNGYWLHEGVCELWDLTTSARDMRLGDTVSSFRYGNYYAPMRVVDTGATDQRDWRSITAQACRWDASAAPPVQRARLVADGPVIERWFPLGDSMLRALPELSARLFPVAAIPPDWLTAASVAIPARDTPVQWVRMLSST